MIIIELIYNLSVLVALSVLSGFIDVRFKRTTKTGQVFQGLLFGITAIIGMNYPFILIEGIIFDGRSIVISLCTLFFGPVSGIIASLLAFTYRNIIGGGGALMGSLVITSSFLIGFFFYHRRKKTFENNISKRHIYLFGLLVHAAMLLLVLALPSKDIINTYKVISLTVIGIYPLVTLIIGKILLDQEENQIFIEKLKESENYFRTTLYSIGDAVITTDPHGCIRQMNSIAINLTGWDEVNAKGKPLAEVFRIINEYSREKAENPVEKVLKVGGVINLANHTLLISKDGREILIADSGAPIKNEDGVIKGVVLVFRDQTEERKSTQALYKSEEKYRYMFANHPQPMWIYDTETLRFLQVNKAAIFHYGYSEEEFLSMTLKDIRPAEDIPAMLHNVESTVKKYDTSGEWKHIKKNGEIIWVEIVSHPISFNNRLAKHVLVKDITEKKKMIAELVSAKEKAEKANKLKTEFLAQMSHEIRSPINVTLSFASLIKDELAEVLTPELVDCFKAIDNSGRRLIRTVDLILNMSEAQMGTYEPTWSNVNLAADVIENIQLEFVSLAKRKGLEFNYRAEVEDTVVFGDHNSLNQIFVNLVDNAIKYTKEGKVEIIVNRDNDANLRVTVADTGIGISEEFKKNLFEPFMQEERGYSRRFEGNGLGLALVKKYCDMNKAEIRIESEKGKGSSFIVTFNSEVKN